MCTAALGRLILEFALDCCAPSTRYGIATMRVANQQVVARPSVAHLGGKVNTADSRVPGDSTTAQPQLSRAQAHWQLSKESSTTFTNGERIPDARCYVQTSTTQGACTPVARCVSGSFRFYM